MTEGRRFLVRGLLGQGGFGHVYLADMVSMGAAPLFQSNIINFENK